MKLACAEVCGPIMASTSSFSIRSRAVFQTVVKLLCYLVLNYISN